MLCSPLLCYTLIIHCQVFSSGHCFWPSGMPNLWSLPAASVNALPYYNITLLCFITQRTSAVKPCGPFNPYSSWLLAPFYDALLPELPKAFFWLFPSLPNILIHSHFKLPYFYLIRVQVSNYLHSQKLGILVNL